MPIIAEIQDRLRLAFPKSSDAMLYRAVQEGAYLGDHLYAGESFLNNVMGRDLRGHFRRVGISYQLDRYCTLGDLPWLTAMKAMPKGPWNWLEITGTGAVAHVCRTADVWDFPDDAESRQDARLSIQKNLFTYMAEHRPLAEILSEIPKLYAWLTFRISQDGRLSHLCWGAPAVEQNEYVGHINVLNEIAKSGSDLPPVNPTPDPAEKLRLKDHIAQTLKKKTGTGE